MKKTVFYLMLAGILFMSCEKSDTPEQAPVPQEYDDALFFQNRFAPLDGNGDILLHLIGIPIDTLDPSVISTQSASLEDAVKKIRPFFQFPDRFSIQDDGSYRYEFRNTDGHTKGYAFLKPGKGGNLVASLEFEPADMLSHVSRVDFLSVWPDNGSSPYPLYYRRYRNNTDYMCIREATPGEYGLFISNPSSFSYSSLIYSFFSAKDYYGGDFNYSTYFINSAIYPSSITEEFVSCIRSHFDTISNHYTGYSEDNYIASFDPKTHNLIAFNIGSGNVDTLFNCVTGIKDTIIAKITDDRLLQRFSYSKFVDGVVHGTGIHSTEETFPQYGGYTYDNGIRNADAPIR